MPSFSPTHRVRVDGLNFRSAPRVSPRTRRAVLRKGDAVHRVAECPDPDWWEVDAVIGGMVTRGFVAREYLLPLSRAPEPTAASGIRAAMLAENRAEVTRDSRGGAYAYPIGEPSRPSREGTTAADKAASLHRIVRWLEVDRRRRYQPEGGKTYCNVYASDYCYLAGAYLPRVWWTGKALERLAAGEAIAAVYDRTVTEMTANMLYRWLDDYGAQFGWSRVFDLDAVQEAANDGHVAIICAQRTDLQLPGHITAVVPERARHRAARRDGRVTIPLQSQAGKHCYQVDCRAPAWWTASRFREFGFWHHA